MTIQSVNDYPELVVLPNDETDCLPVLYFAPESA